MWEHQGRYYNTSTDQEHAYNVPPDADIVQEGHETHTEYVQERVQNQNDRVDSQRGPLRLRINGEYTAQCSGKIGEPGVEQHVDRDCQTIVNTGSDCDLADQVEPTSKPAPASPS